MNLSTKVLSAVLILLVICMIFISPLHAEFQNRVGQYQVIVYSAADYIGESQSFTLNPRSHRILLVNRFNKDLDNKVSSIHVGSKVRAMLFDHLDFHSNPPGRSLLVGLFAKKTSPKSPLSTFKNSGMYYGSTPRVRHNDVYTSMIIIPHDLQTDWGVALYNFENSFARVEPIQDQKKFKQRVIPDFGYLNDKISMVWILGNNPGSAKLELFESVHFKGKKIILPGIGSDKRKFMLRDYNFDRITSSIKLSVIDPVLKTHRAPAPPADNDRTPLPPGKTKIGIVKKIIPISGVILKKNPPPPGKIPEVTGPWHDGHGNDYEIKQQGKSFSWFCPQRDEHGNGMFKNNGNFRVMWNNPKGGGETRGRVTKLNHEGFAEELRMDTGVILYRK